MSPAILTLTTDFGGRDYYVGALKGVALGILPGVQLVDITHAIPAGDVEAGAFALGAAAPWFPAGTVHLAVVDPGVGTARRPLAVGARGCLWVGPDNGLLSHALADPAAEVRQIANPELTRTTLSATFHGRDLFAPAAAHLAAGVALAAAGPVVADPVRLAAPGPRRDRDRLVGVVVHVDAFGNLVTNLAAAALAPLGPRLQVRLPGAAPVRGLAHTYADVGAGEPVALIGSCDLLEIGVNGGSAARHFGIDRGAEVVVEPLSPLRPPSPPTP
ncbi:MAG: SAM-dependent chlorinase/fluorinase [Gemmatimonadota bacterium]